MHASNQGRIVKTESGSIYKLGKLDPLTAKIFALVSPVPFDDEAPLAHLEQLLYASSLARGAAREVCTRLCSLRRKESQRLSQAALKVVASLLELKQVRRTSLANCSFAKSCLFLQGVGV